MERTLWRLCDDGTFIHFSDNSSTALRTAPVAHSSTPGGVEVDAFHGVGRGVRVA